MAQVTSGIFQKTNYGEEHELEVLVMSDTEQKTNVTAVNLFEKTWTDLNEKMDNKNKIFKYTLSVPLIGGLASIVAMLLGPIIGEVMLVFGGVGGVVVSGGIGLGLCVCEGCSQDKDTTLIEAYLCMKLFNDSFNCFKESAEDHKVPALLKSFQALNGKWLEITEKDQLLIKDDLQLFKSTGKLLLMEAICIMLQQNSVDSPLAIKWESVKALNTSCDYDNFWRELGVASPSPEGYLEVNTQKGLLKLDQFNEILKERFVEAVRRGIDKGVL